MNQTPLKLALQNLASDSIKMIAVAEMQGEPTLGEERVENCFVQQQQIIQQEQLPINFGEQDSKILWDKSAEKLRNSLNGQIFSAWIRPLSIADVRFLPVVSSMDGSLDGDGSVAGVQFGEAGGNREKDGNLMGVGAEITLVAPNKFCCEHVKEHYGQIISSTLSEIIGTSQTKLSFKVSSPLEFKKIREHKSQESFDSIEKVAPVVSTKKTLSTVQKVKAFSNKSNVDNSSLNPKYNFSNFVVGACNQFSHAVSLGVSENLGTQYNPLFLYGGVGLGKTHLANAIGNSAKRRGKKVLLVSSETFVNELISSLRSNSSHNFKSRFRSLDLLIIDDIQFLIGKERTLEEFFHTFNDLYQRQKQIVITADKLPNELVGLEERLRTRFSSGVSADLQAPDFETRVAILNKKAESYKIVLPPDVAHFIAEIVTSNVRELEGALNRLLAMRSLHEEVLTLEFTKRTLENVIPQKKSDVTPEKIQRVVADKFSVSVTDIIGKRRTQNIAISRQVAMYLCREFTCSSYPEIGAIFGGRDHSTVIHARKVIKSKIKSDNSFKQLYDTIVNLLIK